MAAIFAIGLSLGTWMGSNGELPRAPSADSRPRALAGETRLIVDQSFEQFASRLSKQGRASAPPPDPASGPQPGGPSNREQQSRAGG
jgi:hypothetical protein